jgi:hypothetical protein
MKNYEIINMLSGIKCISYKQWLILKKCMVELLQDNGADFTDEYVSTLSETDVIDRPCIEVYEEYVEWCKLNYIPVEVQIKIFNKYIHYYFGLNNKVSKCDGKSVRVYCK